MNEVFLSEAFLKILNMSISAGWLVLAVVLLRPVLKKAPRWICVLLWGLVAIRLICPFSMESVLSLIPSAEIISPEIMMDQTPEISTGIGSVDTVLNPVITQTFAPDPAASANPLQILIPAAAVVWLAGIAVMLIYTAISYILLRRKVATAVLLRNNIYQSENVDAPFVLGIIRPKIYLPFKLNGENPEYVIAHEQAHIRRKDHWWKPLGFLLLALHWFNPLLWLGYILLCRDIELACDEKVISRMDSASKADYAQALVACSIHRRRIAACPLAFGEVGVKERVKSVMNYKKPAFWIILAAAVICILVAACFLTDPVAFRFDGENNALVSAHHFDMRIADDAVAVEMDSAQLSELSFRLAGVRSAGKSDEYAGLTPAYQISALVNDGTYIRISGYSMTGDDKVDIEWNGERYAVADTDFQEYLSRICAGGDRSVAENAVLGKTYLYEKEGILGSFHITLYNDGTFIYYEGYASSYYGVGTWKQDGDIITMTDDGEGGYGLVNHFLLNGNELVFDERNSSNFVYVKVKTGEKFHCTGEAFKSDEEPVNTQNQSEIPGASVHVVDIRDRTAEEEIACDAALEKFWEDETNEYYFSCIKSRYIMVMDSTGRTVDVVKALEEGLITIETLDYYGIKYDTEPK